MSFDYSGQPVYVQALLFGFSWTGNAEQSANITYTLDLPNTTETLDTGDIVPNKASILSSLSEVNGVLALWKNVANITFGFTETYDFNTRQIVIGKGDVVPPSTPPGKYGLTFIDDQSQLLNKSETYVDSRYLGYSGGEGQFVLLHEIGHSLGLDHPFDGPIASQAADNWDVSVMSFTAGTHTSESRLSETPMIYDIAAIQYLYGANFNHNSGNTTHSVTGFEKAHTIWDGGGNDTLDAASFTGNSLLDLRPGFDENDTQYVSNIGDSHIFMAFHADIENAIGGSGNDTIHGNDPTPQEGQYAAFSGNNSLSGGTGDDLIYGHAGNDTLVGGADEGTADLAQITGGDTLQGGAGDDTYSFTFRSDEQYPYDGRDIIIDGEGEDTLLFDNIAMQGSFEPFSDAVTQGDTAWHVPFTFFPNASFATFVLRFEGSTLGLYFNDTPLLTESFNVVPGWELIKQIVDFQNGDFGITLEGYSTTGTSGAETFNGTPFEDSINAGAGIDQLSYFYKTSPGIIYSHHVMSRAI